MAIIKPLLETEVPKQFRDTFIFTEQWQEPVPQQTRNHKMRTMIRTICSVCRQPHAVPVNDVRNWIRGVRRQMPGTHRECKYPGVVINGDGYVLYYRPDHPNAYQHKYVLAHIYVMSEHLGRPIDTKNESVHHIDGDKANNDITNLQLRRRYHGKGQAYVCNDCGSHNVTAVALKDQVVV